MEIKRLENSQAELTLTLSAEKIEAEYSKKLNEYAKKLQLPGFRQGKAPASLIESKYGKEIREEVTFKLMEDNVKESIENLDKKDKPLLSSIPTLQNEENLLPFKKDSDVTYSVIYDVYPDINLPEKYTGLDIEVSLTSIDEEKELADRLYGIRERNAMVIPKVTPISEGDIVTLDICELDDNGEKLKENAEEDFIFTVGSSYNFFKIDDDIIGMKAGESKTIEKTYTENMPEKYLNRNVKILVDIKNVRTKDIPELDDDLAQDINSKYKTVQDLIDDVKASIHQEVEHENEYIKKEAYIKKVVDPLNIDVPESLINISLEDYWRSSIRQYLGSYGATDPQTVERIASDTKGKELFFNTNREGTKKTIQFDIFVEKVADVNNFEIPEDEVSKRLKEQNIKDDDPNIDYYKLNATDAAKYEKAVQLLLSENNFINVPEKKDEDKDKGEVSNNEN